MHKSSKIKRVGKSLTVYLKANNSTTKDNLSRNGKIYTSMYNRYLKVPAIAARDIKWLGHAVLRQVAESTTRLPLTTYVDEYEPYVGNLPVPTCIFSTPQEKEIAIYVEHIGKFYIVSSCDSHLAHETLSRLEHIQKSHRKRNPLFTPTTDYTLDSINTSNMYLASTESLRFPGAISNADSILYINY